MTSELHVLRWPIIIYKTILTQIHIHNWIIFKMIWIQIHIHNWITIRTRILEPKFLSELTWKRYGPKYQNRPMGEDPDGPNHHYMSMETTSILPLPSCWWSTAYWIILCQSSSSSRTRGIMNLQSGHNLRIWSQFLIQAEWNLCLHGISLPSNCSKQIEQRNQEEERER